MDIKNNKQEDSICCISLSPTSNKKEQTPDSVSAKSSSKKSDNEPKESVLKLILFSNYQTIKWVTK